jgi:hypothetical protein
MWDCEKEVKICDVQQNAELEDCPDLVFWVIFFSFIDKFLSNILMGQLQLQKLPKLSFTYHIRIQCCTVQSSSQTNKLRGPSQQANYTDRATAACRRS